VSARSERPGEGEPGLLGELLGTAAGAEHADQLATRSALLRLTQAGAHLSASQVLVAEVHLGVLVTSLSKEVVVGTAGRLGGDFVLAGPAAGPLARDHHALEEELSSPDAPRLAALERSVEAEGPDRALLAEGLGGLHVDGGLGEPQLGVVGPAGQQLVVDLVGLVVELSQADVHRLGPIGADEFTDGHAFTSFF
jgi:hypothetical protein